MSLEKEFSQIIKNIFPKTLPKKIAVAVSGGVDSMTLLVLLKNIFAKKNKIRIEIFCISIDHKTRKNSSDDARFVLEFCQKNKIHCEVLESYLEDVPQVDVENSLREVRYHLFEKFCTNNQIKYLFLAHHKQDIAENFLIRLFRGSGIDGLAAMDQIRDFSQRNSQLKIVRPLLEFSKEDLKTYLKQQNIRWREDESNDDEKFLRNKIRKFLKSLPESDAIQNRISLAANAMLEAKNIIDSKTKKEFPRIFKQQKDDSFIVDLEKFKKLEKSSATRYLALCLMEASGRNYKPRLKKLIRIYDLIMEDKLKKEELYNCKIRSAGKSITIEAKK